MILAIDDTTMFLIVITGISLFATIVAFWRDRGRR